MKIKFLLHLILLSSCISAHSQISVTVQSGVGQTFVQEEVSFNDLPDFSFRNDNTSINIFNPRNSQLQGIYVAYTLSENWQVQTGLEVIRHSLAKYFINTQSTEMYKRFYERNREALELGIVSVPLNLTYEYPVWREKLYCSVTAGVALTALRLSIGHKNKMYPGVSYGREDHDSSRYSFIFFRSQYGQRDEVFLFNTGVALGWRFNKNWQIEGGVHYRHGFTSILKVETTIFEDIEINDPNNNPSIIKEIAEETYNNNLPDARHAFTTNGTAFFGTLALTYTFAKKEKDKKQ